MNFLQENVLKKLFWEKLLPPTKNFLERGQAICESRML